jgi:hypothetical protein
MIELKPIAKASIPRALEKAERYRLLNEPHQAESICLDILAVEPTQQQALECLLLSLTDQFVHGRASLLEQSRALLERITSEYERTYYAGIIAERFARRLLHQGLPRAGYSAYEHLREAMRLFEAADALAPEGNDDAVLRWNTCARVIDQEKLVPPPPPDGELPLE